mmetsp:Transcript_13834/g.48842  ORF Transcript_13834/g.48842 Transcript_13834/m.48842 type:complete len:452 (+) Transcript_13834:99-1454(+)
MRGLRLATCAFAAGCAAAAGQGRFPLQAVSDQVELLPGYGKPKTRHFSGYSDATPDGKNKLFYYFVEAEVGSDSPDTPLLIWINGGPGASSLIGLLAENLGPQKITANKSLAENPDTVTKKYHLMTVDNPVGAGFSYSENGAYVKSQEEVRTQFVHALRGFFTKHPEYKRNPLWMTGESYAGKYVPNIALELATNATEIPLQGIVVGNGLYNEEIQYTTVGSLAYGAGVIDENVVAELGGREEQCLQWIREKRPKAGDFCENVTVRWLYTGPDAVAGELFYYDFGMTDAAGFDTITDSLGGYLNTPEVKAALHAGSSTWQNADETGPVAEALAPDFTRPSAPVIGALLGMGKEVFLYNGVRDGSVCNHIGNLKALLNMSWEGSHDFATAENVPWPSASNVMGHIREARNLRFATVMRTGHLVPHVVPEAFNVMLDLALHKSASATDTSFVV